AALEERFAAEVEIERRLARIEMGVHAHVGPARVDRRALAERIAQTVDEAVLDPQRREIQAAQRRALCAHVDAQRAARIEEALPVDALREPVEIVVVAIAALSDRAHHATGEPRPQVRRIGHGARAAEQHAAAERAAVDGAERLELGDERRLEAARARGEEIERRARFVHLQNGLTTTRTTAANSPSTGSSLNTRYQRCVCRSVPAASARSRRPQAKW